MSLVRWILVAVLVAIPGSPGAAAPPEGCDSAVAGRTRIASDRHVVVFRIEPPSIAVGQHFSLEAVVCARAPGAPASGLRVDAHMPEHRHGMNYRATVSARGDGRYVAEGLLFHMPGRWQLVFDIETGGGTARLVHDLVLR